MKKTNLFILASICLPVSAIALLGVGDTGDAFLAKITAEMIVHTNQLKAMISNIDYLNQLQTDVRRGIDDPMNLDTIGFIERQEDLDATLGKSQNSIFTRLGSISAIGQKINDLFGHLDNTKENAPFIQKDLQAIYALSTASNISDESKDFAETGQKLLDDLDGAREGKAIVRNAQAASVQIKQLSSIANNQSVQIALQAQDILAKNEEHKAMKEASDSYLEMLDRHFEQLKEEK